MSRIKETFDALRARGEKALIAYIMAGDPSLPETAELVLELEAGGADIVELGVPFSDPVADGPTIQRAANRALAGGATLRKVIREVRRIRRRTRIPIVLMTYYNPVLQYGIAACLRDAARAGVDGFIVPDLIPDEAEDFIRVCRREDLDTVFLLAPTSTPERVRIVSSQCRGFLYYVSMTGITGAELRVSSGIGRRIREAGRVSGLPVAVGFGVSKPAEAEAMARLADGVIVGSAIVKRVEAGKPVARFVRSLKRAVLRAGRSDGGTRPGGRSCG